MFNYERLEAFPLRSRQGWLTHHFYSTILAVLGSEIKISRKKEINGIQSKKKKVKLSLFTEDMTTNIEKSKEIYKKATGTNIEVSKATGYSINIQKSVVFIYNSMNN